MKTEPIITVAGVTSGAAAIIAVLVSFGVPLTDEQTQAVLGLVAVAAPLVVIVARKWTVSEGAVVERVDKDGIVVAGAASELETGTEIRHAGDLHDADYAPDGSLAEPDDADIEAEVAAAQADYDRL